MIGNLPVYSHIAPNIRFIFHLTLFPPSKYESRFPPDLVRLLISFLPYSAIGRCSLTCKTWRIVSLTVLESYFTYDKQGFAITLTEQGCFRGAISVAKVFKYNRVAFQSILDRATRLTNYKMLLCAVDEIEESESQRFVERLTECYLQNEERHRALLLDWAVTLPTYRYTAMSIAHDHISGVLRSRPNLDRGESILELIRQVRARNPQIFVWMDVNRCLRYYGYLYALLELGASVCDEQKEAFLLQKQTEAKAKGQKLEYKQRALLKRYQLCARCLKFHAEKAEELIFWLKNDVTSRLKTVVRIARQLCQIDGTSVSSQIIRSLIKNKIDFINFALDESTSCVTFAEACIDELIQSKLWNEARRFCRLLKKYSNIYYDKINQVEREWEATLLYKSEESELAADLAQIEILEFYETCQSEPQKCLNPDDDEFFRYLEDDAQST